MSDLVQQVSKQLINKNLKVITAESCTGGIIAKQITDQAGSSAIFERGFITYSNQAKMELLDVSPLTLENFGAVSQQTAREMALGALAHSKSDIALSVTGIAGPGGGSQEKPVGLVYIGCTQLHQSPIVEVYHFQGGREEVRNQSADAAFALLLSILDGP